MSIHEDENLLLQSIYGEYQGLLRRIAKTLNVPDMELDDVVQETFISYFENYSLSWTDTRKKGMLIKILKRKSIDCLRKNGHYEKVSLDEGDAVNEVAMLTRYVVTDPLDVILGEEALLRITREISNMREEWKEMAVLYFLEQLTIPEICEILKIPGTVCRSRIYRTRVCLKKILGPNFHV
ncbi:MAG: sigma-70 family RNA polymerase sigma factor [Hungatella sp.]|jgi:RNA polymerase sigma-70 factor (ECF subfamily)|uniref:Sigma-70 family RNA polymerase sigma factor n=1 Tax=Lacrimispora sp. BS-2 TaxID=3151850 RepID=A0AAU7PNI5_9FIRM|nr:sigma-70 family RNA polymerase sigma factor [Hungatella sp.]MDR1549672.1 sigma-70 family RNA polymerase sigma factor [Hungatella sp.]MDR1769361.1 sigma-70 family RNA polymerase sigma factor [Hungatella sp.]MDR2022053.1 sigma-70 family RNA polymerase sigma factor [Hungatella sp.]